MKQNILLLYFFTINLTIAFAQKQVNQYDSSGKRHGLWTKNYFETDQVRYKGLFKHGKEVDTFSYYRLYKGKSVLSATKVFNETDSLAVTKFYTSKGNIISEGVMNGKKYIGNWVFYHKDSKKIMLQEYYNQNGQLEGESVVFFKNGQIAERTTYKNGKLHGDYFQYAENKILLKQAVYSNDLLNGLTVNYDPLGRKISEGHYKDDRRVGVWKYYIDGKLKKEINHTTKKVLKRYN